jgi:hypothetical protein
MFERLVAGGGGKRLKVGGWRMREEGDQAIRRSGVGSEGRGGWQSELRMMTRVADHGVFSLYMFSLLCFCFLSKRTHKHTTRRAQTSRMMLRQCSSPVFSIQHACIHSEGVGPSGHGTSRGKAKKRKGCVKISIPFLVLVLGLLSFACLF